MKFSIFLRSHLSDLGLAVLLLFLVGFAWCTGTAKWTLTEWSLPTAYLAPITSDVIATFAGEQAVAEGGFIPLARKSIQRLGAPGVANWNDWPIIEEFHIYTQGLLAKYVGIFAALNLWMILMHLLAAMTFFAVARFLRCQRPLAFVGGLAFGLAPFIFSQLPHHGSVAAVWHVPFFLLVWAWVSEEPGIPPGSGKFWFALAVAFFTGVQNVYFTNIFCQLTLLGAVILYLRNRSLSAALSAGAIILAAACAFGLMNLDTFLYHLQFGTGTKSLVREYKWLEIYGLKLVDFFIPPINHLSAGFREFSNRHRAICILQEEGSYLGLVGNASLLFLIGTTAWRVIFRKADAIPREAWQVLWVVAMATTGGLNAILGASGFTLFRASYRYSIIVLAIVLLYAIRRLSKASSLRGSPGVWVAAGLSLLIIWDQMPNPPSPEERGQIARQIDSDRQFIARMEASIPDKGMVFQLPIMEFPESPAPGVPPYDHFRPYLYSKDLRFSFGSMKGREDTAWQTELAQYDLSTIVDILREKGFAAIYINRGGFPDKADGLLDALKKLGLHERIDSAAGDLVCLIIPPHSGS